MPQLTDAEVPTVAPNGGSGACGSRCINRSDLAIMVTACIGVGWTLNLGNPAAWLIIATAAGPAVIRIAAGM